MASEKSKSGKSLVDRNKRFRQNMRTFLSIQKRRLKHAKSHRFENIEAFNRFFGVRTWLTTPVSKAAGKLLG